MLHHVGVEVQNLPRSGQFYDAVFFALGARRLYDEAGTIGWGTEQPEFWITSRARAKPGYGHIALGASGKAAVDAAYEAGIGAGGHDAGEPGPRPQLGPRYYAAYLQDPDGLKLEICSAGH